MVKTPLKDPQAADSQFRVEKRRADAVLSLVTGENVKGCFFLAAGSKIHEGPERIGELLNSATGFFPFEVNAEGTRRTVQYNRAHVIAVEVFDEEARWDPGYDVATERIVSILLSNSQRVEGAVRIYRPHGHERVSDWTRQPEVFRYVEAPDVTFIVNAVHIVAVTEVHGS